MMKSKPQSTRADYLDEIDRQYSRLPVQPGEWTVPGKAAEWECCPATAKDRIMKLVKSGHLALVADLRKTDKGKPVMAWARKPGK